MLSLRARLADGELIRKAAEAETYGVNERTIQRDINDIRGFFAADLQRTGIFNDVLSGMRMDRTRRRAV